MLQSRCRLGDVLLVSVLTLFVLMTSFVSPVLAQDRIFTNVSLEFVAESQLLQQNLDTPVEVSAITYDRQRDRLYALCNSPNQSAPVQFCTLKLTFDPTADSTKIGFHVDIEAVTLTNKGQDTQATLDPGGIAVTPQKTLFISSGVTGDSIIPAVQEFDLSSGRLLTSLPIPKRYFPDAVDNNIRTRGIQDNLGFTSLTLNPTGTIPTSGEPIRLFTATEAALVQDRLPGEAVSKSRLLHYVIGYGPPVLIAEHLYLLDPTPSDATSNGLVELLTLDQGGHFLSLERSKSPSGFNAKLFQMTTGGATDTSRIDSLKGSINGIQPVKKKLLLDLKNLGIPLSDLQGMTFGPRLPDGTRSLLLVGNNPSRQATHFLLFRL